MSDPAVAETTVEVLPVSEIQQETEGKEVYFECKKPGVWGKVYETKSKDGKPAVFARFNRYRKLEDGGFQDNSYINSYTDCDNAIEVLNQIKNSMKEFYAKRDQ